MSVDDGEIVVSGEEHADAEGGEQDEVGHHAVGLHQCCNEYSNYSNI